MTSKNKTVLSIAPSSEDMWVLYPDEADYNIVMPLYDSEILKLKFTK